MLPSSHENESRNAIIPKGIKAEIHTRSIGTDTKDISSGTNQNHAMRFEISVFISIQTGYHLTHDIRSCPDLNATPEVACICTSRRSHIV